MARAGSPGTSFSIMNTTKLTATMSGTATRTRRAM